MSDEDKIAKLKARMTMMFFEPVGKFYESPAAIAERKKKGRELPATLKCKMSGISKNPFKDLRIGKKSKEKRFSDYPLPAALANLKFNLVLIEDLDLDKKI